MFTQAKNNCFKRTSFTINTKNFNVDPSQALGILYSSVAPNAILNAGGRADQVRCHPGTRTEVIGLIDKWRLDIQNNVKANQIFWLSGPAGAGKTAIVQTVAESWKSQKLHSANFFFFRADSSRNDARYFVATLLYQIFAFVPAARKAVGRVLSLKPRILDAGLDEQVDELICGTFASIQPPFRDKIVFLIDGLDECDSATKTSQKQILHVLDKLVHQEDLPFLVLVASRAEPHISTAFKHLSSHSLSVFLDDQYYPEADIRLFVIAEFEKIKTCHPLADFLPSNWPSGSNVDAIVSKSSGQFIYAATVMRFLAQCSAVPSLSLEKVQGIVPCAKNSPFIHLDAFYTYILQQADDHNAIRDILSSAILDNRSTVKEAPDGETLRSIPQGLLFPLYCLPPIQEFLRLIDSKYTKSLFMSCMSDILSIVQLHEGRLKFFHASLSDFLLDCSRSDLFHVDIEEFTIRIMPCIWQHEINPSTQRSYEYPVLLGVELLCLVERPAATVTDALLIIHPSDSDNFYSYFSHKDFLANIARIYYPHEIDTYKQILRRWIAWAVSNCESAQDRRLLESYCQPVGTGWSPCAILSRHDAHNGIPLLRRYLFAAKMQNRCGVAIARLLA